MKNSLTIIRKYPPPMIIKHNISEQLKERMKIITNPKKIKQADPKDVKFCPIWIRKFF